jgi:hypothetical protein
MTQLTSETHDAVDPGAAAKAGLPVNANNRKISNLVGRFGLGQKSGHLPSSLGNIDFWWARW